MLHFDQLFLVGCFVQMWVAQPLLLSNDVGSGSAEYSQTDTDYDLLEEVTQLKASNTKLILDVNALRADNSHLQSQMDQYDSQQISRGPSYIHWGRKNCPAMNAKLVYSGFVAGGRNTHSGSGKDYICVTSQPTFLSSTGRNSVYGRLFGAEYRLTGVFKTTNVNGGSLNNMDAVCSACEAAGKTESLMIPGTFRCPSGWTEEYKGFLAAGNYEAGPTNHICLDQAPEATIGSHGSNDGARLFPVEVRCGSLPCPPYVHNREVSCVVCSK